MKQVLTAIVSNNVFANVLLGIIVVVGVLAAMNLVRESMPKYSLDMILVEVPFPGADPEEVEEGISQRIEAVIDGLEGIIGPGISPSLRYLSTICSTWEREQSTIRRCHSRLAVNRRSRWGRHRLSVSNRASVNRVRSRFKSYALPL